ncbi:hypothetical protein C0993_011725 [Termitomyces sp. T159_Od127]|nr:hypothetical protein C0993_011725 [Termitomyces sp. T159_Od127]
MIAAQLNELTKIQQSLYDLDSQHNKVRTQYEEELHRLRNDLHALRQGAQPPPPAGPGSIGISGPAGPSNPLPGIQIGAGSQPYNNDPYYPRDRERERDKEREREQRERERERDRIDRERESDNRDRERDRARGDNRGVDPDFKRGLGDRDPKRPKQDRIKIDRPDHFSPSLGPGMTPKLPPPPSSSSAAPGVLAQSSYPGASSSSNLTEQPPHSGALVPVQSGSTVTGSQNGSSKVLTINDPDSLNNDAGVTSVAISPNGQFVAAGSLDTVVRIWDVATTQLVERFRGHKDSVYSVAFTPDGRGLVSGSLDKTLKYWDVSGLMPGVKGRKEGANGGPVNGPGAVVRKEGEKGSPCTMNFLGHKDYVLSVAVSHDGQWVVSGSKDRGVQFWDSRSADVQCMIQGHKNSVISIDLSPAGNILATGSGDWQARIWSYTTI